MLFLTTSFIALCIGIMSLFSVKRSLILFIVLISVIPTGNSYADFISMQGLYFFDFYLVGILFSFILKSLTSDNEKPKISRSLLICLLIYISYIVASALFGGGVNKYLLKDLRPIIMIVTAIVLLAISKGIVGIDKRLILKILTVMFLFSAVHLLPPKLGLSVYKDEYYEDNSYRYLDATTYVAAIYMIYFLTVKSFRTEVTLWPAIAFITALMSVFIGNSRFMILAIIISVIIANTDNIKKTLSYILLSVLIVSSFFIISVYVGAERVTSALSPEVLIFQITNRFSPALSLIREMEGLQYLSGLGAGTYFDIPWFAYRGLEAENVSVDSLYFTMYVKYGLFGILFIYLFTSSVLNGYPKKMKMAITAFCLIMYFVSAVPYHPYSLGLIIGCLVVSLLSYKNSDRRVEVS